jgi:hypothetical protein
VFFFSVSGTNKHAVHLWLLSLAGCSAHVIADFLHVQVKQKTTYFRLNAFANHGPDSCVGKRKLLKKHYNIICSSPPPLPSLRLAVRRVSTRYMIRFRVYFNSCSCSKLVGVTSWRVNVFGRFFPRLFSHAG